MKKLVSIVLAASLGFVSIPVSASLPKGGFSLNFMGFNPRSNLQLTGDVISSVKIPLGILEKIFKEKYAYVVGTELWVFNELYEIVKEFVILKHNYSELETILTSYFGIDRDFQKRMEKIKSEIKDLEEKLNSIPSRKPTIEDIKAGKCFNCEQDY